MRRHVLRLQKKFSTKCRQWSECKAQSIYRLRFDLGGITAMAPLPSNSTRSQSASKALSPRNMAKSTPLMSGFTPTK